MAIEEELRIFEKKLMQLKLDYDQYFLGSRPREPVMSRAEIQKQVHIFSNNPIPNTADRFKFNSINSRFQAYKRQWDSTLRQIEAGTYTRHVFKANLHDRARNQTSTEPRQQKGAASADAIYHSYLDAARSCGQSVSNITPEKIRNVIQKQEAALRQKLGCDRVNFRVVVQDGKVKLKATPVS